MEIKHLPTTTPDIIVDIKGVWVLLLMFDKKLNNKPSIDIAYKIRGIGNKHPNKLYAIKLLKIVNLSRNQCK